MDAVGGRSRVAQRAVRDESVYEASGSESWSLTGVLVLLAAQASADPVKPHRGVCPCRSPFWFC
jgi:hypothetical protein